MLGIDNIINRMSNSYVQWKNYDLCCPETSTHPWNLTHLQASLGVSDATVLTVTSLRTELIPQKAVKYAVRWKEMCLDKWKVLFQALAKLMRFEKHMFSSQPRRNNIIPFHFFDTFWRVYKTLHFCNCFGKSPFSSAFLDVLVGTIGQRARGVHGRLRFKNVFHGFLRK